MLQSMTNLTLVLLKEKFLSWESKYEIGGDSGSSRQVANFAGSNLDAKRKKAWVKKVKAGHNKDQANYAGTIICYECEQEGHMRRDCPQLNNSESSGRRKFGGNVDGGGGGQNNFKAARHNNSGGNQFSGKKNFGGPNGKIKSILRKNPTNPTGVRLHKYNGAFIDAGESANMIQEFEIDLLGGDNVARAFAAAVLRNSELICVDSGANIFILRFLLAGYENFIATNNRFIQTAAAGAQLRVEALFNCGHVSDIRYCPEASANLIPTMAILFCRCAVIFDMVDDQARCRIVANESSHGGENHREYVIDCILDNDLFWIEKSTLADIIHRRGFPVVEAQRIRSERIEEQAYAVTAADFAARPFMDRPIAELDKLNVLCWVEASEHNYTRPTDQDPNWSTMAKEECYRESPYGKRFAVHQLGRNPADFPMKEFTHEDENAYAAYVESCRSNSDVRGRQWDFRSAGMAQMLWIEAWNKGQVLLPLPLVDLEQERAYFAQRRVELMQARVDAGVRVQEALDAQAKHRAA